MSLFIPTLHLEFTPDEWTIICRPLIGSGGAQLFLKRLLAGKDRYAETNTMELEDSDLHKVQRYAYDYGGGGYQDRFRAILRAAFRAGWKPA